MGVASQPRCIFAVKVNVPADFVGAQHDHACTEIVFTGRSTGRLVQGEQRYCYGPEQVFVYQPAVHHHVENREAGVHLCLGVSGCEAERLRPGVREPSATARTLAALLTEALDRRSPRQAVRLNLLAGLLVTELHECDVTPGVVTPRSPEHYAATARRMLETHYDQPIAIDALAEALFISPDYLRRVFRREFACSPLEYLIQRRVQVACEMLRHTDAPVRAVADRCGFSSPYYFSRMFKKVVGVSPSCYRRQQPTLPAQDAHQPGRAAQQDSRN